MSNAQANDLDDDDDDNYDNAKRAFLSNLEYFFSQHSIRFWITRAVPQKLNYTNFVFLQLLKCSYCC